MNDILKQRLVGALILVALGVVFWPIVFVEAPDKTTARQRSIPEPPAVSTMAIDAPDAAGLRASPELAAQDETGMDSPVADGYAVDDGNETAAAASASEPVQPAIPSSAGSGSTAVRSEAPQKLTTDTDGVPVAWTIQVATVSSAAKAESLRRKLLERHEKAYVTEVSSGGKRLYRVCVGPKFERNELERMQAGINAEFGVKTMLVRYLP